jgi:hypothetical protein
MSIPTEDGGVIFEELVGIRVSEIHLLGLVRINFGDDRTFELSIERDFTVHSSNSQQGAVVEFRPYLEDWQPTGMNELASLFHSVVEQASAQSDALLLISVTDGKTLEVQPDPLYEAWGFWIDGVKCGQIAGGGLM